MNPCEKNGEIPDINGVFLLKMDLELIAGDPITGEMAPGPVIFPVHYRKELFLQIVIVRSVHDSIHMGFNGPLSKDIKILPVVKERVPHDCRGDASH